MEVAGEFQNTLFLQHINVHKPRWGRHSGRSFVTQEPSSSMKPGGIFGGLRSSLGVHKGQGMPGAPQPQA